MTEIIYLMGAGRSGTTALSVFLGNNENILSVGEINQFFEHLLGEKQCSCGKNLEKCDFWSNVLSRLPRSFFLEASKYQNVVKKLEAHSNIPKFFFIKSLQKDLKTYLYIVESVFYAIQQECPTKYILDSSKYIGRALGLLYSQKYNIKIIYVVRDIRGVIHSFSKNVQTPKKPINTIIYYLAVNTVAQLVFMVLPSTKILKIKYENFIDNPIGEIERLESFLDVNLADVKDKIRKNKPFTVMHLIGGNRLRENNEIFFTKDVSWKTKYSNVKKIIYYIAAAPIQLLNQFKILP